MALDVCGDCRAVEQGWRAPSADECVEHGIPIVKANNYDACEREELVCECCGSVGSWTGAPEHDDRDMER